MCHFFSLFVVLDDTNRDHFKEQDDTNRDHFEEQDDTNRDHFEEQGCKPNLQRTANTDHKSQTILHEYNVKIHF